MRTYQFQPPRYTYSDYKNWKEDWELVNGYPYQLLPSASPRHSKIIGKLIIQAGNSLSKNVDCNCAVFPELDYKINEETVVRPDIMIVCGEPKNEVLEFPPVLIIEILSPYNLKNERVIKFDIYRENGVKYYLMVDVQKETVEVYQLIDNFYKLVPISIFELDKNCQMELDMEQIWK